MKDKTYDAMIKRNGKKKEKKKETKKSNKFSTVPNTGDFGALAAKTKPTPPISKEARVTRADPNKPRPKISDLRTEIGDRQEWLHFSQVFQKQECLIKKTR